MNNRKMTKGRNQYQQDIKEAKGKDGNVIVKRSIKHIQATLTRLNTLKIILDNLEKVTKKIREPKKIQSYPYTLIWNSKRDGTYIKAVHGLIGSR